MLLIFLPLNLTLGNTPMYRYEVGWNINDTFAFLILLVGKNVIRIRDKATNSLLILLVMVLITGIYWLIVHLHNKPPLLIILIWRNRYYIEDLDPVCILFWLEVFGEVGQESWSRLLGLCSRSIYVNF